MANEVELITFANKTVSPVYDAIIQELYTDGGGVITGCTVTIKDANHLHITEGYGVLCGREFKIVASDIPVQLSSSGNLNGRLYLHMDLSLATDPITLLVETGSTLTPVQQDANVNTTNGVYEINLATFTVGTSAISNLQDVAPKAVKIPDALNTLNSKLTAAYTKICETSLSEETFTNLNWSQYSEFIFDFCVAGAVHIFMYAPISLVSVDKIFRPNYSQTYANIKFMANNSLQIMIVQTGYSGSTCAIYAR